MAVTTLFALSNPGGKRRIRLKSRKAPMARRGRRRRKNPKGSFMKRAVAYAKANGISVKAAMKALKGTGAGGKKSRKRKGSSKKRKGSSKKRKSGGKLKSAKRVAAGKKAARTRARNKKGGKKKVHKRKGSARRAARRPRKGIYRPYARFRRGKKARFGSRAKRRMTALGLAHESGGHTVLNPRRRRRRKSRSRNPRRRHRKARRSNPRRRRASRRRSRNPRRRRNPVARRRRSRRRRNPMGIVRGVKGLFSKAKAMRYARLGLGAMLGMAVARQGPQLIARIPVIGPILNPDSPLKALLASAAAIGAGVLVARKLRVGSDIVAALIAGGAGIVAAGTLKLASQRIPILGRIPGVAGMGDVVSPSQLVAGEAIFGGNGMGDYLQLSGPVPEQYFAGGLNDYVEFQNRAAGAAAEAASAAQVDWSPGVETSF